MDKNYVDFEEWHGLLLYAILILLAIKGRDIWNWLECMFSLKYGYC